MVSILYIVRIAYIHGESKITYWGLFILIYFYLATIYLDIILLIYIL